MMMIMLMVIKALSKIPAPFMALMPTVAAIT